MSNSFGKILKITTFGESHGKAIGGIIDGFPPNININFNFIQNELDKRKPGNSNITSTRKETDKIQILSGIFKNKTLGTPIGFIIPNKNQKPQDYYNLKNVYRPGHADFTYHQKYEFTDYRGGGRASARETAARVAAGAFAKIFLNKFNIKINAYTSQIGDLKLKTHYKKLDLSKTYNYTTRCPDEQINNDFIRIIKNAKKNNDSIGGIITCIIKKPPIGLGEPVFNKLNAKLAQAILSINACKGFEIGKGFNSAKSFGSQNNDQIYSEKNNIKFLSNNAGGIAGGISTGQDIVFNAAFKPTPSILKKQKTIDFSNNNISLQIKGRHDPCIVPRAAVIVEAMTALTIADFILLKNAYNF